MHKSHQEEHSIQWGHQKQKFNKTDRFMNRRGAFWNDKITSTLNALGTTRSAVGRKIWSKIFGKISTGVILVYLLVFDTTLDAVFWMHYSLHRLNLESLLKSEMQ